MPVAVTQGLNLVRIRLKRRFFIFVSVQKKNISLICILFFLSFCLKWCNGQVGQIFEAVCLIHPFYHFNRVQMQDDHIYSFFFL